MMQWLKRDNSAATSFLVSAAMWVVIGTLMGLVLATEFVFPDFAKGIPWLVFSRLRQAHVNTVLFAWLSGAMMGAWLYIVPRLTGRKIYSELARPLQLGGLEPRVAVRHREHPERPHAKP